MRLCLALLLSSSLALLMGCSAAKTAGSGAMASMTGIGAAAAMPDLSLLPKTLGQASASDMPSADDHADPESGRPPRPVNPGLLAQRAKLQELRTNTILGKSRALLHNSDLDALREAMRAAAGKD